MQIQSASMQRLELIGRIFAETGLKDFYRKCVILYQKHMRQPFVTKIRGVEEEVTPEMIQGAVYARVNMGVEATIGVQEAQKIERMLQVLFSMNQQFPGLLTPEKIHNISRKYITSMGFKQVDDFISDMQKYMQDFQQAQQANAQMQQQMMQMQAQLKQMELSLKDKEIGQEGQLRGAEIELDKIKDARKYDLGVKKVEAGKEKAMLQIKAGSRGQTLQAKMGLLGMMRENQEAPANA
jgi:hypothetical protein